jgi:predicted  nucleic acid-binding Zn-ribbon protein
MPELYGNERKDKIRAERASLRREIWNEQKEHSRTRRDLQLARAKIAEQAAQIERMKQMIQGAISEADRDIASAVVERYKDSFRLYLENAATG